MADENMNSESPQPAQTPQAAPASSKKMNPMPIIAIIVIAIIAIAGYFFMNSRNTDTAGETTSQQTTQQTQSNAEASPGSVSAGDVMTVQMEAGNFYFKPNVIRAKLGQTVQVQLNAVSMQHDFVIDDLGVKSAVVPSGQSTTIEFVADTVGEFEFYCSVGNHRQMGMVGTLIVEQ